MNQAQHSYFVRKILNDGKKETDIMGNEKFSAVFVNCSDVVLRSSLIISWDMEIDEMRFAVIGKR